MGTHAVRVRLAIVFCLVFAVALFGGVATAAALTSTGQATFSAQTPADGSSVGVVRPPISVKAYDPKGLAGSPYYSMKVDGVTQIPTFSRQDANNVTLSFTPRADLVNGTHTVYVSVKNNAGVYSTCTWSFTVSRAPLPSAPSPVPGSTITTTSPTISVTVGGATAGLTSVVTLDGATVPSSFSAATGLVTAPTTGIANDRSHDVTVTVTNSAGQSATLAWSFAVQIYAPMPTPASSCVTCHPGFPDAHPMDNCLACHGPGSPVGEGWNVPDYGPHSSSYIAQTDSSCIDCHSGGYATVPPMHAFTPVATYHDSTTACSPCHVKSLTTEHFRYGKECLTCHASANPLVSMAIATGRTDCEACHPGAAAHTAVHQTTVSPSCAGASCHAGAALTDIHTGCDVCHKSADARVVAAIDGGIKTCDACHSTASHEAQHATDRTDTCAGCHAGASLTTVHFGPGSTLTCSSCHASSNPLVTGAISAHDKTCATCHVPQHALDSAFCYGCHTSALRTYPGKSVAQTTDHLTATSSSLALTVYPGSGAPAASCYNCHASHDGTVRASGNALCTQCHDATSLPAKPAAYSYQGAAPYATAAHSATPGSCATCHAVHGSLDASGNPMPAYLTSAEPALCLGCHASATTSVSGIDIAAKFANANRATHHDVTAADQAASGARLACSSCHDPHTDSSAISYSDPTQIGRAGQSNLGDYIGPDGRLLVAIAAQHDGVAPSITATGFDTTGANFTAPVVTWTTNEPATSWVDYGPTTAYGTSAGGDTLGTAHSVKMGALTAGTTYHWRIRTKDAVGNTAYSADRTYTPVAGGPPAVPVQNANVPLNPSDPNSASVYVTLSCQPVTAPDGHAVQYEFYASGGWSGGDGYVGYYSGIYDSGWINAASYGTYFMQAGPASGTSPIAWKVRARDKIDQTLVSDWSPVATFNVDCGNVFDFVFNWAPDATPFDNLALNAPVAAPPASADGQQLAMLDAPRIHYSANTDLMSLKLTSNGGGQTTLAPSSGWQSAATSVTVVSPSSPGTAVDSSVLAGVASANGTYWISDLATTDKTYNVQVASFDVSAAQKRTLRELRFTWTGHGEPTPGYSTSEFIWNYRTGAWEPIRSQSAPVDVTVYRTVGAVADTMCLSCHSGSTPAGVVVPSSIANVGSQWSSVSGDFHGRGAGTGYAGGLSGYQRSEPAIACTACHDPHGTNSLYGIPSQVNGVNGVGVTSGPELRNLCSACHTGTVASWHQQCADCHSTGHWVGWVADEPATHTPTESSDCTACHGHGKGFQHNGGRSYCESCHGVGELNALTGNGYTPVYLNWPRAF